MVTACDNGGDGGENSCYGEGGDEGREKGTNIINVLDI